MSLLQFHMGNVPIIEEDDMRFMTLKIKNNTRGGFEWVSTNAETSEVVTKAMEGAIDAVKVIGIDEAKTVGGDLPSEHVGICPFLVNYGTEHCYVYLDGLKFMNDDVSDQAKILSIYQDGDRDIFTDQNPS